VATETNKYRKIEVEVVRRNMIDARGKEEQEVFLFSIFIGVLSRHIHV
jgi:hypothetical protein